MNTTEILKYLEEQRCAIETAIHALNGRPKNRRRRGTKTMSIATRSRISLAKKLRWKERKAKTKA